MPDAQVMTETSFPRFGAEDFTPFINGVMENKPDGVLISLWGGDLVNFVRQANSRGFFDQGFEVLLTVGAATEVLSSLGEQMAARSEERRVGKEGVRTCRSRWSPCP